jgi:hypothetical protein
MDHSYDLSILVRRAMREQCVLVLLSAALAKVRHGVFLLSQTNWKLGAEIDLLLRTVQAAIAARWAEIEAEDQRAKRAEEFQPEPLLQAAE